MDINGVHSANSMYNEDIKVEKGEYTTKTGLTDCVYKNRNKKLLRTEDYNIVSSKSLLESKELDIN